MGVDGAANDQALTTDSDGHLQVDVLTGGGGGTERTDDTEAHANGHAGTGIMAVATPTDGSVDANDYGHLAMSTDRRLHVDAQIVGQDADITIADGGNIITVDGTVTADAGTGPWPVTDNGASLTVDTVADATDGSAHGASQTGFRAMGSDGTNDQQISVNATGHVNIANVISVDDGAGSLTVDNAGTFAVQDATVATNTTDLPNVIGTDGAAGPTNVLSCGGTDGSGNIQELSVDTSGFLAVNPQHTGATPINLVSTNNSTTGTLGISGVFTGTGDDCNWYTAVTVQLDSSHDSATDGMTFQFSIDNVNWDDVYTFTYTAANGARRFQFPVTARYFRIVYTNGGTGQSHFRVQTILHRNNVKTSVHRLVDSTSPDRSATVVKSAIIAQAAGSGDFVPVQATAGGNLKVAIEENDAGNITVNMAQVAGTATSVNAGNVDAGTQRVVLASDQAVISIDDNAGSLTVDGTVTADAGTGPWPVTDNAGSLTVDAPVATPVNVQISDGTDTALVSAAGAVHVDGSAVTQPVSGTVSVTDGLNIEGDVAHDAADSGNPIKVGAKALSHGTNPTEVANNDRTDTYANVAGVPFMIGGHPNVQTFRANYTAAETDTQIVAAPAGEKIVVTRVSVTADNANTADVQARIGFGATTTPTGAGVLLSHPGIAAGSGVVEGSGAGMLGVGAADEDLRITSEVPSSGSIDVVVSYYTIAS
jgi:hypothetical protein